MAFPRIAPCALRAICNSPGMAGYARRGQQIAWTYGAFGSVRPHIDAASERYVLAFGEQSLLHLDAWIYTVCTADDARHACIVGPLTEALVAPDARHR